MDTSAKIKRFQDWALAEYGEEVHKRLSQLCSQRPDDDLHDLLDEALEQVYPVEAQRRLEAVNEPFRSDLLFSKEHDQ